MDTLMAALSMRILVVPGLQQLFQRRKWFARVVCSKVSSPQLNGINYKKLDKKLKELNKSVGELQRALIIVKTKVLEEKL